jgi:heme A synthase
MNIDRVRHVLNAIMILCLLIFGGLMGIVLITDTSMVASKTIALPFAFLFLFIVTLITTGRIQERPKKTNIYLREWLMICTIIVIICALAVTFA